MFDCLHHALRTSSNLFGKGNNEAKGMVNAEVKRECVQHDSLGKANASLEGSLQAATMSERDTRTHSCVRSVAGIQ